MSYDASAPVHAVKGAGSFAYDANGNMTTRTSGGTTYIQTYNSENQMTDVQSYDHKSMPNA